MTRRRQERTRADARSLLLLGLAIVPIVVTGWFSLNQWRDSDRELAKINDAILPVAAGYHGYEIFDRLGRSELLIEALALPEPPAEIIELARQDRETLEQDLDDAVAAFEPYIQTFAAELNQTEELTRTLVTTATGLPLIAIENYEEGEPPPIILDLILRPSRDGLHDMVPIIFSSTADEEQLLGALMVLDHDHDLDALLAMRGDLERDAMRLADLRLPTWNPQQQLWSLELRSLSEEANIAELMEFGSLASDDNPIAPPLLALIEAGRVPSIERDEALVAVIENDLHLDRARERAYGAFLVAASDRVDDLRQGRLIAIIAGLAMTWLALALLRLVVVEVSERRRVARAHAETLADMAELANSDALTGLRNRRWLDQTLPTMLTERGPDEEVVLAYLDMDRFKSINDVWGHHNGDMLLRVVSERLRAAAQTLPGLELVRFGGDEFVGVSTMEREVASHQLDQFGAVLLAAFEEPVSLDGKQHEIQSSIGVAMSNGASTMQSLLVDADLSMLQAKRSGRGRVVVDKRDDGRASELVQALPDALANSEFSMHLQPVVEAATGDVCHYEALARWTRPNGEQISPAVFVPLIESFGLADQLTGVMLGHVAEVRRSHGPDVPRIWINVSPVEFNGPDLGRRILDRLTDLDIPPGAIGIEMTERSAIGDLVGVEDELRRLRSHGVLIAIDDFGAGYSPLGHLRDLPVDVLKIDRALVACIDNDPGAVEIVRGIIGFARSLGLELVAEGVETEGELDVLRAEGIDLIQGFLTGRPGPAADVLSASCQIDTAAEPVA